MGSDKRFILGLIERWHLITATLLIAYAIFLSCYAYDLNSVSDLTQALFFSIVGAGVILKKKIAVLIYKILLWGGVALLLIAMTNPHVIVESHIESYSLIRYYCFCTLAIAACSGVLTLIVLGQRREERNRR